MGFLLIVLLIPVIYYLGIALAGTALVVTAHALDAREKRTKGNKKP